MINFLNAEINIATILIAVVVNIAVGMFWFHPKVMGTIWAEALGKKIGDMKMDPLDMVYSALASLVLAVALTLVVNYGVATGGFVALSEAFGAEEVSGIFMGSWSKLGAAVATTLICWIGVVIPVLSNRYIWEGKNAKLLMVNSLHMLLSIFAVSLVITLTLSES